MNKKLNFLTLWMLYIACGFSAFAAIPSGYYSSLNGKSGEALKTSLFNIIRPHTQLQYSLMWTYYHQADVKPNTEGQQVWDMYSNNTYYFSTYSGGSTYGMNREHSVPKSWWGNTGSSDDAIMQFEAGSDLMHLYPSDGDANTAKSYYPLGHVSQATFDNGSCKVGYPANGEGGGAQFVFEPSDEYKGDFARTYFYMATCYQDYTWKYQYMYLNKSNSYLSLKPWAYNMLLDWARKDPVSQKEIDRNEVVYKIQGNRNPFIDDPTLMEYIWGDRMAQVYTNGGTVVGDGTPKINTPEIGSEMKFGEIGLGKSLNLIIYVKGQNLTGNVTLTLYGNDKAMFSCPVSQIPSATVNSASGYKLTVTYNPTAIGSHSTKLIFSDGGITGSVSVLLSGACLAAPSLTTLKMLNPEKTADKKFRLNWVAPAETIDYYIVTRTTYSNGSVIATDQYETTDLYYDVELADNTTDTYSVQSLRLGYLSSPSNLVTIDASSGVNDINFNRALAASAIDGGVRLLCNETLTNGRIINAQGQLVKFLPEITDGTIIELPLGVYMITADGCKKPLKILVK